MSAPRKTIDAKAVTKAYKSGDTLAEIAKQQSCDPRTVRNVLIEAGVTIRPRFNQSV